MGYSIGDIAKIVNLSTHTIRFYEKEGLISIPRKANGLREFSEKDINLLKVIVCLKETKMPICEIKKYIALCKDGLETRQARKEIFIRQKQRIENEITRLHEHLELSNYKIWYYENIDRLGNENDPENYNKMHTLYRNEMQMAKSQ